MRCLYIQSIQHRYTDSVDELLESSILFPVIFLAFLSITPTLWGNWRKSMFRLHSEIIVWVLRTVQAPNRVFAFPLFPVFNDIIPATGLRDQWGEALNLWEKNAL